MIGEKAIRELLGDLISVDIGDPLMKSVHLMMKHHLNTIPVMKNGELVGVLREKDIILEPDDVVVVAKSFF